MVSIATTRRLRIHYTCKNMALETVVTSGTCAPPPAADGASDAPAETMRALPILVALTAPSYAYAQHGDHGPPAEEIEATRPGELGDQTQHVTGALRLPMSRLGSGTAWLPDEAPTRAFSLRSGGWHFMLHGNVFVGYDYQAGDAGDDQLVSQNWLMAMAGHELAGGLVTARAMLSLEPLTLGKRGYPLLLQSGEQVDGQPLVDRQHPHDLIMEAAAMYERDLTRRIAFQVYAALAGEPALGPVGFPHRPSAMTDPLAPLGHHWQDSTHITFGVLTAGLFTRTAKLEASWFNGREPDDERYDLDLRAFDSASVRLTLNPSARWSLQASGGYLASPEQLEPDVSIVRTTASATHARKLGRRHWASTIAWGRNIPSSGPATDAVLVESVLDLDHLGATFARAEYVTKTGHDLALMPAMEHETFPVAMLSVGHTHPVLREAGLETALGLRGSVGVIDADLENRYGTRLPLGVMAYVQVQPQAMQHRAPHARRALSPAQ
jgi:hypothetical protein